MNKDLDELRILIFDFLILRRKYILEKDFKESDRLRKILTDEGIEIQDISSENWCDTNFETFHMLHFKCKDLHHCIREMDHVKRLQDIKQKLQDELIIY